jgi:hypothetical protein
MVRIGIEASERIGLACEAEAVAGPAVMSVPPNVADDRLMPVKSSQPPSDIIFYRAGTP